VLVPLFNEHDIAPRLVARLSRLEYPQDKLEVLLILEHSDSVTANALAQSELPDWMRIITVPPGSPQTKPRALNYALDFANGEIIGIYDAEDAPAPDQLRTVADTFAKAPPNVACLQGVLDFYNAHNTWLTRCFAIDYATWFRLVLPGLVRLGFAIPLGGTTVFFRRRILEKIGRWDAHNVTEDADLGLRLARRGYRTEFISSVTFEEATATVPAWIRQRSRWIKGYAVTWAVHMRAPKRLLNELGLRKFLGFQILFLGTLSQFVLAPYLWSFWLVLVGLPHPLGQIAPWGVVVAFAVAFLLCEIATIIALALSVATPRHRDLIWWVPLMHLYFPLSAFACWKAIAELTTRPFYWDKTAHGGPTSRPKRRWRRPQLQHHV
jgi:cellulose synthase/poly-beta-1,6-N-acetylglucosamine synthase-like glycosyltransferase